MKSWKEHEKLAKHYAAIGTKEIYLSEYEGVVDFPWHLVVSLEEGGSHRLDISTNVWFRAVGPSGLKYRWSFEIEPRSASGKGSYELAIGEVRRVLSTLPPKAAHSFKDYLLSCAKAVRKKGDEWNEITKRQYEDASKLEELCAS